MCQSLDYSEMYLAPLWVEVKEQYKMPYFHFECELSFVIFIVLLTLTDSAGC